MSDRWHPELSQYLDGGLGEAERAEWERRLGVDPDLRAELAAVAEARERVRALPPVEPPPGALDEVVAAVRATEVLERRTGRRAVAASIVATAAVWLAAAIGVTPAPVSGDGTPSVAQAVSVHRALAGTEGTPIAATTDSSFPPAVLDGLPLRSFHLVGEAVHANYGNGERHMTVLQQPGRVVWERLPADGRRVTIGEIEAWEWTDDTEAVLVVERQGVVYTFVTPIDGGHRAVALSEGVPAGPEADRSIWDRLGEVCSRTVERVGLG